MVKELDRQFIYRQFFSTLAQTVVGVSMEFVELPAKPRVRSAMS